jgi:hypothetical protein
MLNWPPSSHCQRGHAYWLVSRRKVHHLKVRGAAALHCTRPALALCGSSAWMAQRRWHCDCAAGGLCAMVVERQKPEERLNASLSSGSSACLGSTRGGEAERLQSNAHVARSGGACLKAAGQRAGQPSCARSAVECMQRSVNVNTTGGAKLAWFDCYVCGLSNHLAPYTSCGRHACVLNSGGASPPPVYALCALSP